MEYVTFVPFLKKICACQNVVNVPLIYFFQCLDLLHRKSNIFPCNKCNFIKFPRQGGRGKFIILKPLSMFKIANDLFMG